jgi:Xaa-Pro dipeptidase
LTGFDHPGRLARTRAAIEAEGAAGVVLVPGPNLRWLSGVAAGAGERLLALAVRAAGAPVLLAPAFERELVERELSIAADLRPWRDGEDPFAAARGVLGSGEWLLDPHAPFRVAERLRAAGVVLRSAERLCARLRGVKDRAELDVLRRAQRLTLEVLAAVRAGLEPGRSEREVADGIAASFRERGADGWALVQFGESSAVPHAEPGERRLREEDAVLVDLGAVVDGYHADLTRSWWHGDGRPAEHARVARAVEGAQAAAADAARAGAPAGDVDRAARSALAAEGLAGRFTHRLGHGLGLEIHEDPYLVEGSVEPLEAGQVVTIEPGAYLPERWGVRHEDAFVVTEGRIRPLEE